MNNQVKKLTEEVQTTTVNFSKPHMQRAIVIALLSKGVTRIVNPSCSSEINALYNASMDLGLKFLEKNDKEWIVQGVGKAIKPPKNSVNIRGSGALLRILIAIVFFTPGCRLLLHGNPSLIGRPMECYLKELEKYGLDYDFRHTQENFGLYLEKNIKRKKVSESETICIRCDKTSQFLTALLLVAPISSREVNIKIKTDKVVSKPYVDLTIDMITEYGVSVKETEYSYTVSPKQYNNSEIVIPSDFTSASYLIGAALTNQSPVIISNYIPSSFRAEKIFMETVKKMGLSFEYDRVAKTLYVTPDNKNIASHLIVNAEEMPTVVPTLTAIAPFYEGIMVLYNASHVEYHKTQRMSVIINELKKTGINYHLLYNSEHDADGFVIAGAQFPTIESVLDPKGDHRNFMSLYIATKLNNHKSSVIDEGLVHASFPNFIDQIHKISAI